MAHRDELDLVGGLVPAALARTFCSRPVGYFITIGAKAMFRAKTRYRKPLVLGACSVAIACLLLGQSFSVAQPPFVAGVCPPRLVPAASNLPSPPSGQQSTQEVVVACVGLQQITAAVFQHWNAIVVAESSERHLSETHAPDTHKVLVEVMEFLVPAEWIIGEAHSLGVHIAPSVVRREFNHLYKQQFHTQRKFRSFLNQTKQTLQDVLLRVELDLLSQRIQKHVVAGHRSLRSQKRAIKEFESNFRDKWMSQTYCAPQYAVKDCGHIQTI